MLPSTNISPSSVSITKSLKSEKILSVVIDVISSSKTRHQTPVYNSLTSRDTIMAITPSRASVSQTTSFVSVPITTNRLALSPTFQVMLTTSCFLYLVFSKSKSDNIRALSSGLCQERATITEEKLNKVKFMWLETVQIFSLFLQFESLWNYYFGCFIHLFYWFQWDKIWTKNDVMMFTFWKGQIWPNPKTSPTNAHMKHSNSHIIKTSQISFMSKIFSF